MKAVECNTVNAVAGPPAAAVVRRVDSDGNARTKEEFVARYGGTTEWDAAPPEVTTPQSSADNGLSSGAISNIVIAVVLVVAAAAAAVFFGRKGRNKRFQFSRQDNENEELGMEERLRFSKAGGNAEVSGAYVGVSADGGRLAE